MRIEGQSLQGFYPELIYASVVSQQSKAKDDVTEESNQRKKHRQRTLKGATIISGPTSSEIACTIRNQHGEGAELKVSPDTIVPDHFLLYVPVDGIGYRAVVRWRKNDRIGVEFTGTAPKPRFHYG